MMRELRLRYPIPLISRLMNVSTSGYYTWRDRPLSQREKDEVRLELEIKAAHRRTRQTYGTERLQQDLNEHGVQVGLYRIRRIRKKLGIRCKQKRRRRTSHAIFQWIPTTVLLQDHGRYWCSGNARRYRNGYAWR